MNSRLQSSRADCRGDLQHANKGWWKWKLIFLNDRCPLDNEHRQDYCESTMEKTPTCHFFRFENLNAVVGVVER
jgi:hypothetical protein